MNENMKQQTSPVTWLLLALLASTSLVGVTQVFAQDQAQVQIYGSQLMTAAERTEYQAKMRTLKTDKERDAFRLDHHTKMTARAAERGITLPSTPPGVGAGPKSNTDRKSVGWGKSVDLGGRSTLKKTNTQSRT